MASMSSRKLAKLDSYLDSLSTLCLSVLFLVSAGCELPRKTGADREEAGAAEPAGEDRDMADHHGAQSGV